VRSIPLRIPSQAKNAEMVIVERSSSSVSRSGPPRIVMRIVFGLAAALTFVSARAEPLSRTILLLDEDTPIYPWFRQMSEAFYATIKTETANPPFVFIENLGIDAYATADYFNILRSHFREKYRDKAIGVIVSNASRYLPYTLRLRDELWPGTPVVLAGIQERRAAQLSLPSNVTGFTFRHQLQDIVATADALIPGLKRVVLAGSRIERGGWRQDFLDDLPDVRARFEVIDLTGLSLAELRQRLTELPGDSAVVYVGFSTDVTGEHYLPAEASQLVAEAANRPTFGDSETFIGTGIVGGPVISPGGIGRVAARFALRILDGENASDIPITNREEILTSVFDWRQLQRWGISENRLPLGSEIRFRSPTAWEQYRWQIMVVSAALVLQSLLIGGLFYEHRRRRQAEVEASRRMAELAHMNRSAAIGQMSASIVHEINQPLAAIVMNAGTGLRWLGKDAPNVEKAAHAFKNIVGDGNRASQVVETLRAMFKKGVSSRTLVDINDAVREVLTLLHIELEEHEVLTKATLKEGLPRVMADRVQLQQVIFNLVTNAIEAMSSTAAGSRILRLKSEATETGECIVAIEDSGPGIEPETLKRIFEPFFTSKSKGMGMGLSVCRSIVEAHGGRLWVAENTPRGAVFQFVLPVAAARD
jgi:signal transduction histidine kinase